MNRIFNVFLSLLIVLFFSSVTLASVTDTSEQTSVAAGHEPESAHKEGFDAGEMIIEHIIDAHEWHILTIGHTHVSIPLPVILIDNRKIVAFMSNKFHHGTASYKGYKLQTEGPNKGKIVKVKEDGSVDETAKIPLDFSITKLIAQLFISLILLTVIFISIAGKYKKNPNRAPSGLQSLLEPLVLFISDEVALPAIGKKKYQKYLPYLLTIFFFIFFSNLLGLVPFFPGGANLTGNLAVTMVLALFTFAITTFSGNKSYWVHIVNTPGVPWWLKIPLPLMPIVEFIGVLTKPFVLMVRLFANILAGHIIGLGFMSLIFIFGAMKPWLGYVVSPVSVGFGIFMTLLELLVAFIQAYVFTLLSAIYFGMAIEEHHHELEEETVHEASH
jgi:F-type H+-transporting ATPase subunit a